MSTMEPLSATANAPITYPKNEVLTNINMTKTTLALISFHHYYFASHISTMSQFQNFQFCTSIAIKHKTFQIQPNFASLLLSIFHCYCDHLSLSIS